MFGDAARSIPAKIWTDFVVWKWRYGRNRKNVIFGSIFVVLGSFQSGCLLWVWEGVLGVVEVSILLRFSDWWRREGNMRRILPFGRVSDVSVAHKRS